MELVKFEQAVNKLKLDKKQPINNIEIDSRLPLDWVKGRDFLNLFLPYLKIKIDSREQDDWVEKVAKYFNIQTEIAVKDKKAKTENLKEGDITFCVQYGDKCYDYTNVVAYERKGSASEFCNNVMNERDRLEREFERQLSKGYRKFVLMLEIGNKLDDLIDYKFYFYNRNGELEERSCGQTVFATVSSWTQPNKYSFQVIQCDTQRKTKHEQSLARMKLFWLMLYDMYYFFRQEIRLEAQALIDEERGTSVND